MTCGVAAKSRVFQLHLILTATIIRDSNFALTSLCTDGSDDTITQVDQKCAIQSSSARMWFLKRFSSPADRQKAGTQWRMDKYVSKQTRSMQAASDCLGIMLHNVDLN